MAITAGAAVTPRNLVVANGKAPSGAAGADGNSTIADSTIFENQGGFAGTGGKGGPSTNATHPGQGGAGGASSPLGNGGGIYNTGTLIVTSSTIAGNKVVGGGDGGSGGSGDPGGKGGNGADAASGGGIWSDGGSVSIANGTIAGNDAADGGIGGHGGQTDDTEPGGTGGDGGDGGAGGGVQIEGPTVTPVLLNDTIADNVRGFAGPGGSAGVNQNQAVGQGGSAGINGVGGGVVDAPLSASDKSPATELVNTLLADNSSNCVGGSEGKIVDGGHNLSFGTDDDDCPSTFANGDPRLGTLADNGGPTETIALQAGSAAIDQIPATGVPAGKRADASGHAGDRAAELRRPGRCRGRLRARDDARARDAQQPRSGARDRDVHGRGRLLRPRQLHLRREQQQRHVVPADGLYHGQPGAGREHWRRHLRRWHPRRRHLRRGHPRWRHPRRRHPRRRHPRQRHPRPWARTRDLVGAANPRPLPGQPARDRGHRTSPGRAPCAAGHDLPLHAVGNVSPGDHVHPPGSRPGERRSLRRPTKRLTRTRAKRCTRQVPAGKLVRSSEPQGPDAIAFSGRIGRRPLRPGLYRATLQAFDADGASGQVTVGFTVVL